MTQTSAVYEIHVHGDIPLRKDVSSLQIEEALAPLWRFVGASSWGDAATSHFHEEPGLVLDLPNNILCMCWTIQGDDTFDQILDELCRGLNEIAREGAPIEVCYFDTEDDSAEEDFRLLFVGPTPQAIVQAQRDLLTKQVEELMECYFDANELTGVVAEIDKLFSERSQKMKKTRSPMNVLCSGVTFGSMLDASKKRLH